MSDRLTREREKHNELFAEGSRGGLGRFYSLNNGPKEAIKRYIQHAAPGKRVLEFGCGPGTFAFDLAANGADVVGIDISDVAIEQAKKQRDALGFTDRIHFEVMNAEELTFDNNSFDLVFGSGILHHLDIEKAYHEIARVLRPTGRALFNEPMEYNPFVRAFRLLTPSIRTPDEHPLIPEDFTLAEKSFGRVDVHHYYLGSPGLTLIPGELGITLAKLAGRVDETLLRIPVLQKYAWLVKIVLGDPRK